MAHLDRRTHSQLWLGRRLAAWPLAFVSLLVVSGTIFVAPAAAAADKIIYTSVEPLRYLVDRVTADVPGITSKSFVAPGQSPVTYEPSPSQLKDLAKASLFFRCGLPFERSWSDKLAQLYRKLRQVDLRNAVVTRTLEEHSHGEDGHQHDEDELDPHIWTDPMSSFGMAVAMADELSTLLPQHKATFSKNLDQLMQEFSAKTEDIQKRLASRKQRSFLVFHPAWGYYADRFNLKQVAIEHQGKEPGPKALAQTIRKAKQSGAQETFVQEQFSDRQASVVAKEIGGRVVRLDPLQYDLPKMIESITAALTRSTGNSKATSKP